MTIKFQEVEVGNRISFRGIIGEVVEIKESNVGTFHKLIGMRIEKKGRKKPIPYSFHAPLFNSCSLIK